MIINHHFRVELKAHKFNSSTVNKRFSHPVISNLTSHFFISNRLRSSREKVKKVVTLILKREKATIGMKRILSRETEGMELNLKREKLTKGMEL
jgi:hypothetical protein